MIVIGDDPQKTIAQQLQDNMMHICIFAISYNNTIFHRSFSKYNSLSMLWEIKGKENVKIDYKRNKSNKNIKTPGAGAASLVSKLCHSMSK